MTKQTCKNCAHCKPSYKGGVCEVTNKKVKLSGPKDGCDDFRPKS